MKKYISLLLTPLIFTACSFNYQAPEPNYAEKEPSKDYHAKDMTFASYNSKRFENSPKTNFTVYKYDGKKRYNSGRGYESYKKTEVENAFNAEDWNNGYTERPYKETNKYSGY